MDSLHCYQGISDSPTTNLIIIYTYHKSETLYLTFEDVLPGYSQSHDQKRMCDEIMNREVTASYSEKQDIIT